MRVFLFFILFSLMTFELKAQWIQMNEAFGGNSVGTIKTVGSTIFAGTFDFGLNSKVYKSTDNGLNWTISNSGLGSALVHTFATIGSIIFAATYSEGVFKSVDNGTTWTNVLSNIPNVNYYSLGTKDSVIIVGTDYGALYQSTDLGINWINVVATTPTNYYYNIRSNSTHFFAASSDGPFISTDNGLNWNLVDSGLTISSIEEFLIQPSYVFSTDNFRVYRTSNNGTYWETVTNNLSINSFKRSFGFSGSNQLIGTSDGVFVNPNNGQNWIAANSGLGNNDVNEFDTLSSYIFAATNIGIFRIDTSQINTIAIGINEINEVKILNVYPNPSHGKIKIEIESKFINDNYKLQIFNTFGQTVLFENLNNQGSIDLSHFPKGIYFLEVKNLNISLHRKIIIE